MAEGWAEGLQGAVLVAVEVRLGEAMQGVGQRGVWVLLVVVVELVQRVVVVVVDQLVQKG